MATPSVQIQISEPEYKLLQTLVYQECGMYFDERRAHFLQDRLQRRLKICGLDTFYAYYRLLTSHQGKAELSALVENLTVNETSFFRNKPQLELFQKNILEELLQAQAGAARLEPAPVVRGMFHRAGTIHHGHAGVRRAGLLLPAQSASL